MTKKEEGMIYHTKFNKIRDIMYLSLSHGIGAIQAFHLVFYKFAFTSEQQNLLLSSRFFFYNFDTTMNVRSGPGGPVEGKNWNQCYTIIA